MVALYIYTFLWINRISQKSQNCDCSKDWRRSYLYFYFIYVLVFFTINTLYMFSHGCSRNFAPPFVMVLLSGGGFVLALLFIISAFQYVKLLKTRQCTCATKDHGDNVLTALAIIQTVIMTVSILMTIFMLFVVVSLVQSLKGLKK